MDPIARKNLRTYFILAYVIFWLLLVFTGLSIVLKVPPVVQTAMETVCAWAPTFALLIMYKRVFPGVPLLTWLKKQFPRVCALDFVVPAVLQVLAVACAVGAYLVINGKSLGSLQFVSAIDVLPLLVVKLTSGPMGEELGWRAYALNERQKTFSPLVSSLFIGVIWGFWHLPLWLLSGYSGGTLALYVASFLVAIISTSVLITFFYNRSGNILVAVWVHFLFNFLLSAVKIDTVPLLAYTSITYLVAALLVVAFGRRTMMRTPTLSADPF
ncbi:MAG: CPBP family intramembrane metalloprotease [Coriobacteriia bacterium]|nr:CPBP family intramembrane metalloprotease [Coriobacteriia bacterium]